MMTTAEEIVEAYASLDKFTSLLERELSPDTNLQFRLSGITITFQYPHFAGGGSALDDIEFFEIKHLALLGDEVKQLFSKSEISNEWTTFRSRQYNPYFDPDGLKIGTFYVYDSYSMEVRKLRRELENDPDNEDLRERLLNEEERIKGFFVICSDLMQRN